MSVLNHPALVLNKSWIAITTTSVRRALTLMYVGVARAVDPITYETYDFETWMAQKVEAADSAHETDCIRTVDSAIRVPEVILLTLFNGMPSMNVVFSRRNLFRRDNNQCQYCGRKPGIHDLSIDHVIPRSRGGDSSWENCVLACTACNRKKSDRTPAEANMRLLHKPVQPNWAPHIEVTANKRRHSWQKFIGDRWHTAFD